MVKRQILRIWEGLRMLLEAFLYMVLAFVVLSFIAWMVVNHWITLLIICLLIAAYGLGEDAEQRRMLLNKKG